MYSNSCFIRILASFCHRKTTASKPQVYMSENLASMTKTVRTIGTRADNQLANYQRVVRAAGSHRQRGHSCGAGGPLHPQTGARRHKENKPGKMPDQHG